MSKTKRKNSNTREAEQEKECETKSSVAQPETPAERKLRKQQEKLKKDEEELQERSRLLAQASKTDKNKGKQKKQNATKKDSKNVNDIIMDRSHTPTKDKSKNDVPLTESETNRKYPDKIYAQSSINQERTTYVKPYVKDITSDNYVKDADKYLRDADKYVKDADKYVKDADKYVKDADKYVKDAGNTWRNNERYTDKEEHSNTSRFETKDGYSNWSRKRDNDRPHDNYRKGTTGSDFIKKYDSGDRPYNRHINHYADGSNDKDFNAFNNEKNKTKINFGKVEEKYGDLFSAPIEYSLAHCVAEDMSMGAGIAVSFRNIFKRVPNLLNQYVKTGGVAVLEDKDRFIYYLVTKERSYGKPTYYTLWLSLNALKKHMNEHMITKLALPQIGCGLDRLYWTDVKQMLEYVFKDDEVEIVVYSLQDDGSTDKPKIRSKGFVTHAPYPLIDIEKGTALFYLGTEDGYISKEMQDLESKYFDLSNFYSRFVKKVGEVFRTEIRGEVLYGLIVKKTKEDTINYLDLEKCCKNLKPLLRNDQFQYIGLQAFIDDNEALCLDKIINVLQSTLSDYSLYICWPSELSSYAPNYSINN